MGRGQRKRKPSQPDDRRRWSSHKYWTWKRRQNAILVHKRLEEERQAELEFEEIIEEEEDHTKSVWHQHRQRRCNMWSQRVWHHHNSAPVQHAVLVLESVAPAPSAPVQDAVLEGLKSSSIVGRSTPQPQLQTHTEADVNSTTNCQAILTTTKAIMVQLWLLWLASSLASKGPKGPKGQIVPPPVRSHIPMMVPPPKPKPLLAVQNKPLSCYEGGGSGHLTPLSKWLSPKLFLTGDPLVVME